MMNWCEKHNLPAEYSRALKKWECEKCRKEEEKNGAKKYDRKK
jgi:hypothetical protein